MAPPPSSENTDTPSTLATMFSRMKSQLTSSTSAASSGNMANPDTTSLPGSPAGKTRSKMSQPPAAGNGTPSKIPVPVAKDNNVRPGYNVSPSPSKENVRGNPGTHAPAAPQLQAHAQYQGGHTQNNPMPPPSQIRSVHPIQDSHHAQAVASVSQQVHRDVQADDIHMMTVNPSSISPAVLQSLANEPAYSAASTGSGVPLPSIAEQRVPISHSEGAKQGYQQPQNRLGRANEDTQMKTVARSGTNAAPKEEQQLALWEREILASPEVKRKTTLAQLYFLDYYFDLLGYLHARKGRLNGFKSDVAARGLAPEDVQKEYKSYAGRERVLLRKRRIKLRVEQFRIIAQVGQGGYGSVYLARKADTGQVCALKKMRKTTLAKMDEVKHVLIERDILTATKTPWLVSLLYAFQDREHVYLAMEYVPGGDFRTLLNNSGVLKEEHARFYSAEMFMGVSELHKLGYIHRDLKPENFLVDSTGHVKLTDFGLATGALNPQKIESMKHKLDQVKDEDPVMRSTLERRTMYRSMRMAEPRYADSVVGSPDYMPPEVLRGKTYTFSADYWSLGCILFEFLCGFPPFSGSTPDETWVNLKNWHKVLRRPVYDKPEDLIFNLSDEAWDAVVRLIAHPKDRIATVHEVQSLQFYQNLPFKHLRQTPAPFIPMLDSDTDVGYFDSFNSAEDMAKYAEVFKKQADVEAVAERGEGGRNAWVGFTFGRNANNPAAQTTRRKPDGEALYTMF